MRLVDVAKRAKVSIATVSRVVNNVGPVKTTTGARVLKAMQELKYHPNIHARTLAGGKSSTVGMIVSNLANPFFLDIFRSLESEAHRRDYDVLVANTDYNPRQLLASGFQPTAMICVNDFMALSVVKELREHGLAVPKDVSVTGYDNISLSEYAYPHLPTVNIPREVIRQLAFSALVPENHNGAEVRGMEYLIDPELVIHESTGPAPKS